MASRSLRQLRIQSDRNIESQARNLKFRSFLVSQTAAASLIRSCEVQLVEEPSVSIDEGKLTHRRLHSWLRLECLIQFDTV